jgi:hypothetical protein
LCAYPVQLLLPSGKVGQQTVDAIRARHLVIQGTIGGGKDGELGLCTYNRAAGWAAVVAGV